MRIKKSIENINSSSVQDFYNKRVASYQGGNIYNVTMLQDKKPYLSEERNNAEISKLLPKLKLNQESCVLDLACGFGRWLDAMPLDIKKYRGIDFSDGLIQLAKSRNTRNNAEFFTGSVLDADKIIPDEIGSFNRILMMGLIPYMNDDDVLTLLDNITKSFCVGMGGGLSA